MQASSPAPPLASPLVASTVARAPTVVVTPPRGLQLDVGELWRFRELLFFLVWRDVKVRYKQTLIGAAWALIQPVTAMLIFTLIFGRFADIPSEGLPYPVFVFAGLLVWLYFSQAVSLSATSIVSNASLVTKVYFPRLFIPLAGAIVPLVDFAIATCVLVVLMLAYGIAPGWEIVALPALLLVAIVTALGIGLCVSALNVRYRDVPYAIPFLMQVWMYATPIVYPLDIVEGKWHWLLSVNPMAGVVEGFRWALLGVDPPSIASLAIGGGFALLALVGGLLYFARVEQHFADVI